jgi:uncharacterized membrane protein YjjP (DUF1212 family)
VEAEAPDTGSRDLTRSQHDAAIEVLMLFVRLAHDAGYPTADLEDRVLAFADTLGLTGMQVSATPTMIDVAFGTLPYQQSYTLRVRPAQSDLGTLSRLDAFVKDARETPLDPQAALAELRDIESTPTNRSWPVLLAAYSLAGFALTPVLGGSWREAIAAAIVGVGVGATALLVQRRRRAAPIVAPLAAIGASIAAATLVKLGLNASPDLVTLAALVTFLPGMTLTVGMQELSTEHLQSGVANTANALVQLLGLVFGVAIGRSVAENWFGPARHVTPHAAYSGAHLLAAAIAGVAFTVTLRARTWDAPVMCAATVLALSANEVGRSLFGAAAGVFVAALAVGLVGGLAAPALKRSSVVFIVPGVFMLVPGSAGFESVLQLLSNQTVSGVTTAFDTFVSALSISYGLMVSTLVLPRRFSALAPRRLVGH